MQGARLFVLKQRDRHTPGALARDTPIGSILDHARDALLTPRGSPLDLLDITQRIGAQMVLIHADEPLRRRAEDQWSLVAPAMRVAVAIGLVMSQATALLQHLDNRMYGLLHFETGKQGCVGQEPAVVSDRVCHGQAVLATHDEVIETVTGRCMYGTGARFQSDVIAHDDWDLSILERMLELQAFQLCAVEFRDRFLQRHLVTLQARIQQLSGNDQAMWLAVLRCFHEDVVEFGPQGDSLVGRQGPGSRGPDDDIDWRAAQLAGAQINTLLQLAVINHLE